jgi:Mor family transcriptional regulator
MCSLGHDIKMDIKVTEYNNGRGFYLSEDRNYWKAL